MARPGITKNRKFRRLVRLLNMPAAHVLGHLEMLWNCAYESADPYVGGAEDVEDAAGWAGDAGKLCAALLDCRDKEVRDSKGFLESAGRGRFAIHDFWQHAPEYVRKRRRREDERRTVSSQCPVSDWTTDAEVTTNGGQRLAVDGQRPPNGSTPTPTPTPLQKKPTATTRERARNDDMQDLERIRAELRRTIEAARSVGDVDADQERTLTTQADAADTLEGLDAVRRDFEQAREVAMREFAAVVVSKGAPKPNGRERSEEPAEELRAEG